MMAPTKVLSGIHVPEASWNFYRSSYIAAGRPHDLTGLVLGLGTRMRDPCICVVFDRFLEPPSVLRAFLTDLSSRPSSRMR